MKKKKMLWYNLALMAFMGVWGFGNIINGFATYGGVRAVIPWFFILILYFLPYSLIVGELGATFPNVEGGVSSWLGSIAGPTVAYFAGWIYWVVHMPYISQKPSKIIIACGWAIFKDNRIQNIPIHLISIISLIIFIFAILMALRGINFLKRISSIAGMASFILSLLYIVMMFSAKAITGKSFDDISLSLDMYKPIINEQFFLNLSILVLAVGGCEKVSPYVKQMKKPSKDFPTGIFALVVMTAISALLGTIAMGMMFDSNNIPKDLIANGGYYAFQMLGKHYGLGDILMVLYAICEFIIQIAVTIISIDAPLRMLLDNADKKYIPERLFKKNKNEVYINGVIMVAVIVGILIIIPIFGIGKMNDLVIWLVKINSVCMPLRYLLVFTSYIMLKNFVKKKNMQIEYCFIKNPILGKLVGGWCFIFTAAACIMGMYSKNKFEMTLNIILPIILIGLGFIMPQIAKIQNKGTFIK